MIYYRLEDFFANHRNFVRSRSWDQQRGLDAKLNQLSKCDPITHVADLADWIDLDELSLNQRAGQVANPCGLIAKYHFTDEFDYVQLVSNDVSEAKAFRIDSSNIVDRTFEADDTLRSNGGYWLDVTDPHLAVWFNMVTLSTFDKLYGVINGTLQKSQTYKLRIQNKFDVETLGGKKSLVIRTVNNFGGENDFLPMFFILASAVSFGLLLLFIVAGRLCKRRLVEAGSDNFDSYVEGLRP